MTMNKIQFQPGLSVEEFQYRYGTEALCEAALLKSRWPDGYRCPRCAGKRASITYHDRRLWECLACGYQCSDIAGTIMQCSKLPLTKWFLAMYLLTQSKNAIAALEMMRQLGVSYKSAWLLKHKLLEVMTQCEAPRKLSGRIEIDDAYLGGERTGGKRGRGSENKVPFIAAVSTTPQCHPLYLRLDRVTAFSKAELERWAHMALSCPAAAVSDGLSCFGAIALAGVEHQALPTGSGKKAAQRPEFRWVNTVLGNLKTALSGTYHAFDFSKYAQRYLSEFQYRFNRRFNLYSMLPQLLYSAVRTMPQPEIAIRMQVPEACN